MIISVSSKEKGKLVSPMAYNIMFSMAAVISKCQLMYHISELMVVGAGAMTRVC